MGFIMSFVSITRPDCGKVGIAGAQGVAIIQEVIQKVAVSFEFSGDRFRHGDGQDFGDLNAY